jgi:hypothetical protein
MELLSGNRTSKNSPFMGKEKLIILKRVTRVKELKIKLMYKEVSSKKCNRENSLHIRQQMVKNLENFMLH